MFLSRMTMQINEHNNFLSFLEFSDELLEIINFWMCFLSTAEPLPIQIVPGSRKTIITVNNSIWVYHGNNFEQICLP